MLRLADTRELITFDEVRSLTVEVIARELGRVIEVVNDKATERTQETLVHICNSENKFIY